MNRPSGRNTALISALSLVTVAAVIWSVTGSTGSSGVDAPAPGQSKTVSAGSVPGNGSSPEPDPAGPVLAGLSDSAPAPSEAGLTTALEALLRQRDLGDHVGAVVVDVASGRVVFGQDAAAPFSPASTVKLLTAAAALSTLGPDYRIETKVVIGAGGQLVLVGAGDPTLSTTPPAGFVPAPASMPELARATAAALKAKKQTTVRLAYDTTLFTGPRTPATWPASYVTSGVVSPVTALSVDEGRIGPIIEGTGPRVPDPPAAAARSFARLLTSNGITVTGTLASVTTPASARPLASVRSPALSDLVGWMLTNSDNDLAEALAHLVGRAAGGSADFAGGARAVTAQAAALGLPTDSIALFDGSGLAGSTKVAPGDLSGVLSKAAGPDQPKLRSILSGLPIAGFSGTLAQRFGDPATKGASGIVRAKTGTLRTVGALAGTTVDADGRLLAFAFLADRVPDGGQLAGRAALDRIAARLASCGCS